MPQTHTAFALQGLRYRLRRLPDGVQEDRSLIAGLWPARIEGGHRFARGRARYRKYLGISLSSAASTRAVSNR